jgi:hypothetical protein
VDTRRLDPRTPDPAASPADRRWWLSLVLLYLLPWLVYAVLLALQPIDDLAAWHNDVAWPAERYLTIARPGLLLPILGQWLLGGVGGLLLAALLRALASSLCRLLRARDLGPPLARLILVLAPLWAFLHFKALPATVTVFARGDELDVHRFSPWTALPQPRLTLRGHQLRALGSFTLSDRHDNLYLLLYARTRDGALVELGQRACLEPEPGPCLRGGDEALTTLARWLEFPASGPPDAGVRSGHHLLRRAD